MPTATEILPEVDTDISDPDEFCHFVRTKSLIQGGPVVALCGKKWIPHTIKDALDKPIHPVCEQLFELLDL